MSQKDELKQLIERKSRRLHQLKMKEATSGINTPPEVLIEIDDLNAEIPKLQAELENLPPENSSPPPPQNPSSLPSNQETQNNVPMERYYTYRIQILAGNQVRATIHDPNNTLLEEPQGSFSYKGALKKQVDTLHQLALAGQLQDGQPRELGQALFNVLFDDMLRYNFVKLYHDKIRNTDMLLRIELDINEYDMPELVALPWEMMCLPEDANMGSIWLGTAPNLIFSRRRAQSFIPNPIELKPNEKLRIALVVADVDDPDLGKVQYEKVLKGLEKLATENSDQIELLPIVKPATPESIDNILTKRPHLFHFIGHGRLKDDGAKAVGEVALVDDIFEEADWVKESYFSELFVTHTPALVLMQSCESGAATASKAFTGIASRLVQQNIPVVMAMQYAVSNSTATRFAMRFYAELAKGDPVDRAAQYARRAIALGPTRYDTYDFATPVIFMRVKDGHLFQRGA